MHCMSSNGLEDAEWNVRTLKMIQEVSCCQLLKIWKQLQSFWTGGQGSSSDPKIEGG